MKQEEKWWKKGLYWTPRLLGVIYNIFLYTLILEVFEQETFLLSYFFIALVPGTLVLIALLVAWRLELIGGVVLVLLSAVFGMLAGNRLDNITISYVGAPLLIIGLLFIIEDYVEYKLGIKYKN